MKLAINYLFQAFPDHNVAVSPRPDGTFLVSLRQDSETFSRVLATDAVFCEQKIRQVVRDIQRDMKLASGELQWKGETAHWVWQQLPTYNGAFHVTKAKRLSQPPLAHMRPTQIDASMTA